MEKGLRRQTALGFEGSWALKNNQRCSVRSIMDLGNESCCHDMSNGWMQGGFTIDRRTYTTDNRMNDSSDSSRATAGRGPIAGAEKPGPEVSTLHDALSTAATTRLQTV